MTQTQTHDIDDRDDAMAYLLDRLDIRTFKTRAELARRREKAATKPPASANADPL